MKNLGTRQRAHPLRCACPHPRVPFRCSSGLRCALFHSRESVRGVPACPFRFKRSAQDRAFAFFCRFARDRICASFWHRSRVCTCGGTVREIFPG